MFSRSIFLIKYWLFYLLFFEVCRVVFLLFNYPEFVTAGFANAWGSLVHGMRMDMSMAAYIRYIVSGGFKEKRNRFLFFNCFVFHHFNGDNRFV